PGGAAFPVGHIDGQDLAAPVPLDSDGDQHRLAHHHAAFAHLLVAGVEDEIRKGFGEGARGEGFEAPVQALVDGGDGGGREGVAAQLLGDRLDFSGRNTLLDYPYIKGDGLFTYHVFGASHYQQQLERIAGGRREAAVYFRVNAVLSSEPDNPYDANAIQIRINGEKVGYIRREDNVSLRASLNAVGITGDVQCRAEIAGGWNRGEGNVGDFGLKLDVTLPVDAHHPRKGKPKPT